MSVCLAGMIRVRLARLEIPLVLEFCLDFVSDIVELETEAIVGGAVSPCLDSRIMRRIRRVLALGKVEESDDRFLPSREAATLSHVRRDLAIDMFVVETAESGDERRGRCPLIWLRAAVEAV